MIQYRKILELHFNAISQRTISTSVGKLPKYSFRWSSNVLKILD